MHKTEKSEDTSKSTWKVSFNLVQKELTEEQEDVLATELMENANISAITRTSTIMKILKNEKLKIKKQTFREDE